MLKKFLLILPILLLISVVAESSELKYGVFLHDVAPLFGHTRREKCLDINVEYVFGDGVIRPNIGYSGNSKGNTSKIYVGLVAECRLTKFFANIAFGGTIHDGAIHSQQKRSLGSRVLFRIAAEIGWRLTDRYSVGIMFDHISNAKLARYNDGLDTIGVRFGWSY